MKRLRSNYPPPTHTHTNDRLLYTTAEWSTVTKSVRQNQKTSVQSSLAKGRIAASSPPAAANVFVRREPAVVRYNRAAHVPLKSASSNGNLKPI